MFQWDTMGILLNHGGGCFDILEGRFFRKVFLARQQSWQEMTNRLQSSLNIRSFNQENLWKLKDE